MGNKQRNCIIDQLEIPISAQLLNLNVHSVSPDEPGKLPHLCNVKLDFFAPAKETCVVLLSSIHIYGFHIEIQKLGQVNFYVIKVVSKWRNEQR